MRKTSLVFSRFISLLLSFLLGFFSFGGILVGAGYIAYNYVSIDFLKKFGLEVETEQYFDKNSDIAIDSLTLKELFAEVQHIYDLRDEVTINFLQERYGLKLGEDLDSLLPEGPRDLPITTILGENGLYAVLETINVQYVIDRYPEDTFSDALVENIKDKTLADVVDMKLGYIFNDVDLGYVLGLEYEKNADGEYELVPEDPDCLSFYELIAPIKLGAVLEDAQNGDLDVLKVIDNNLSDVTLKAVANSLESVELPTIFGPKTLGEIIEIDEEGNYFINSDKITEGVYVGEAMGYVYDETDGLWYEDNGKVGDERTKAEPLFNPICGTLISEFISPGEGRNANDVLMDSFRREGTKLGVVMGYYQDEVDGIWYLDNGAVGDARTEVDHFFAPICNAYLADILDSDAENTASDAIMEQFRICETKLGDMMGYVYDKADGKWYLDDGKTGSERTSADSLFAPLCDIMLYELIDHPDGKPAGDVFKEKYEEQNVMLGDLMGYTKTDDGKWMDGDEVITGIGVTVAEFSVSEILNGELDTDKIINDLTLAEVYGLSQSEKLPVYLEGGSVDISDKVNINLWYNDDEERANAIISALAPYKVSDLEDQLNTLKIADVMDLVSYDDPSDLAGVKYYTWDIIDSASGKYIVLNEYDNITAEFADLNLDGLSNGQLEKKIEEIPIGKFLGFTQGADGKWSNSNGVVSGILGIVADATTETLEDKINETTVGDVAGYIYVIPEGQTVGSWYVEYISPTNNKPATGLLASLADLCVKDLSDEELVRQKVQDVKIGDVLGYTYIDGEYYQNIGGNLVLVEGFMSSIAGSTVSNVENEINNIPIAQLAGYHYNGDNGKWYTDKEFNNEAHGVLVAFADLTVGHIADDGELSRRIQSITIADVFEYQQDPVTLKWYYTNDDGSRGAQVKGVMAAIADSKISAIADTINNKDTGDLLGYTYGPKKDAGGNIIPGEYWWYDESGEAVHPLMNKVSGVKFSDLSTITDTLTVGDIILPEDRETGYLSLIDEDTTLNNLPEALNDIFDTMTIRQLYDAGVIKLESGVLLNDAIANRTINELIHFSLTGSWN